MTSREKLLHLNETVGRCSKYKKIEIAKHVKYTNCASLECKCAFHKFSGKRILVSLFLSHYKAARVFVLLLLNYTFERVK